MIDGPMPHRCEEPCYKRAGERRLQVGMTRRLLSGHWNERRRGSVHPPQIDHHADARSSRLSRWLSLLSSLSRWRSSSRSGDSSTGDDFGDGVERPGMFVEVVRVSVEHTGRLCS